MALGDYTKTIYVNGSAPALNATNLNNNETKTDEIDLALSDGSALDVVANKKRIFMNALIGGI